MNSTAWHGSADFCNRYRIILRCSCAIHQNNAFFTNHKDRAEICFHDLTNRRGCRLSSIGSVMAIGLPFTHSRLKAQFYSDPGCRDRGLLIVGESGAFQDLAFRCQFILISSAVLINICGNIGLFCKLCPDILTIDFRFSSKELQRNAPTS